MSRFLYASFLACALLTTCRTVDDGADIRPGAVVVRAESADSVVVDIGTRPGVSLRLLVLAPAQPTAAVVMFPGGDGVLGIDRDGRIERDGNFLVRSRDLWRNAGFVVAVPDAPSDHRDSLRGFRQSGEFAVDVAAVVSFVHERYHLPVWLIGTSQGSNGVVNATIRLGPEAVAGIVLSSSVSRAAANAHQPTETVFGVNLTAIRVPALVVAHTEDACEVSPPSDAPRLRAALSSSPRTDLIVFDGGAAARSSACEAFSPHGYYGIEDEVVGRIAAWVRTDTVRR